MSSDAAILADGLLGRQKLVKERTIPENAISIEEVKAYPAYFYTIDVTNDSTVLRRPVVTVKMQS